VGGSGFPEQVPVNAGAAAGVNVQRPQRVSARTNDVGAREARRIVGCPGILVWCAPSVVTDPSSQVG